MLSPARIYTLPIVANSNPRIFLSAGEASGDHYGAQIIAELRTRHPHLTTFGLCGREMEAAGLHRIVRAEDVAHMGITEILRHALYIHSQYRALVRAIKRSPPSLAISASWATSASSAPSPSAPSSGPPRRQGETMTSVRRLPPVQRVRRSCPDHVRYRRR